MLRLAITFALFALAAGHGSMLLPPARGGIDATIKGSGWDTGNNPATGTIEPYTCKCVNGTEPCLSGQGCFWFSQGCNIGCDKCTGNGTRLPNLDQCPESRKVPPSQLEGALNPKYRTTNLKATPGSIEDIWKYNPWRAPGKAPVFDSCGMAGGNYVEVFNAGAYKTTKFAKQGDLGTHVLKPRPTGITWKRGSTQKPRWELTAAHGGGYQYRLCKAGSTLNEECFSKNPLKFATTANGTYKHTVIGSNPTKDHQITGTVVAEGGGVGWALNPFGYGSGAPCDWNPAATGQHCHWGCAKCKAPWWAADGSCPDTNCAHHKDLPNSSHYGDNFPHENPNTNTIEDTVIVPSDIDAGDYVLQWRWDCEATSQIWTSCSDVTIA